MPSRESRSVDKIEDLYVIEPIYKRFDQKCEMLARSTWDSQAASGLTKEEAKEGLKERMRREENGFKIEDYALVRGSRTLTTKQASNYQVGDGGLLSWKPLNFAHQLYPPQLSEKWRGEPMEISERAKKAAETYGADLVGICDLDQRWIYSHRYDRATKEHMPITFETTDQPGKRGDRYVIPEDVRFCVVMATAMDFELVKASPTILSGTATGLGYSRIIFLASLLAEFIRGLGYTAIPCVNDTALSVPLAISAGLGQLGRNGLLITPQFGSSVRLCKIFTNLPLNPDRPIDFGVTDFCETCRRCAERCPTEAISFGDGTTEPRNVSNNPGILKWPIDAERCLRFWNENYNSCVVVCPYSLQE